MTILLLGWLSTWWRGSTGQSLARETFAIERGCYDEWCSVTFETATFAAFIVSAQLDVVISSGDFFAPTQYVDVTLGAEEARCGEGFERCSDHRCVDDRDVTTLARNGDFTIALVASEAVVPGSCTGGFELFDVEAVLSVTISATAAPTVSFVPSPSPTTSLMPTHRTSHRILVEKSTGLSVGELIGIIGMVVGFCLIVAALFFRRQQ
mmetsp:Transcript_11795/g.35387  ORF Transcript_11795/g.35387 Transcript_11795/m.35387 type:complete len:208 (-) Transcript_11795:156-779(-)